MYSNLLPLRLWILSNGFAIPFYRPYRIGKVSWSIPHSGTPFTLIFAKISQNSWPPIIVPTLHLINARFSAVSSCWPRNAWLWKMEMIDSTGHSLFWHNDSQSRIIGERESLLEIPTLIFRIKKWMKYVAFVHHNMNFHGCFPRRLNLEPKMSLPIIEIPINCFYLGDFWRTSKCQICVVVTYEIVRIDGKNLKLIVFGNDWFIIQITGDWSTILLALNVNQWLFSTHQWLWCPVFVAQDPRPNNGQWLCSHRWLEYVYRIHQW